MRESAHVILVNKQGQLLMQLRDNNPEIMYPDHWGLFGGEIDEGEDALDGLNRELQEEIPGCTTEEIYKLGSIPTKENLLNIFVGVIEDPEDNINKNLTEGVKAQFFEFEKIKDLKIAPHIKKFILDNKDGLSYVS